MEFNVALGIFHPFAMIMVKEEGNVLFNDTLNTFYLRLYDVRHIVKNHSAGIFHPFAMSAREELAARVLLYASSHR